MAGFTGVKASDMRGLTTLAPGPTFVNTGVCMIRRPQVQDGTGRGGGSEKHSPE